MSQIQTHEVKLEKTVNAPRAKVVAAWTTPGMIAKWFAPGPMVAVVHSLDARPGGQYEIAMTGPGPDGTDATHTCTGTFHEVSEQRIVMRFNWSEEPLPNDTTLTVSFEDVPDGTKVVLHHTGLPTQEAADMHAQGWEGCMAKLPDVVA